MIGPHQIYILYFAILDDILVLLHLWLDIKVSKYKGGFLCLNFFPFLKTLAILLGLTDKHCYCLLALQFQSFHSASTLSNSLHKSSSFSAISAASSAHLKLSMLCSPTVTLPRLCFIISLKREKRSVESTIFWLTQHFVFVNTK